jgi:hypothetical protein
MIRGLLGHIQGILPVLLTKSHFGVAATSVPRPPSSSRLTIQSAGPSFRFRLWCERRTASSTSKARSPGRQFLAVMDHSNSLSILFAVAPATRGVASHISGVPEGKYWRRRLTPSGGAGPSGGCRRC